VDLNDRIAAKTDEKNLRCGQRATAGRTAGTGGFLSFEMMQRMTGMRKHRSFNVGSANASNRPRSCENMISDAAVARQRWLAPASARGQAAIACISGLTPASFGP
jgi:hypothetical protein